MQTSIAQIDHLRSSGLVNSFAAFFVSNDLKDVMGPVGETFSMHCIQNPSHTEQLVLQMLKASFSMLQLHGLQIGHTNTMQTEKARPMPQPKIRYAEPSSAVPCAVDYTKNRTSQDASSSNIAASLQESATKSTQINTIKTSAVVTAASPTHETIATTSNTNSPVERKDTKKKKITTVKQPERSTVSTPEKATKKRLPTPVNATANLASKKKKSKSTQAQGTQPEANGVYLNS